MNEIEHKRGVPNVLAVVMMLAGLGGTGYGYMQSNVTRGEADRGIATRNRYEDELQHCQERYADLLLKYTDKK